VRLSLPADAVGNAEGARLFLTRLAHEDRAMPNRCVPAALIALVVLAPAARAAETCPAFFADGRRPELANPKLSADAVPLCYEAFALLHSGRSRTPLYAAERLTRRSVAAARLIDRADAFHDEERLPPAMRARLDDYLRSGFDRGHMAPAGDMPTDTAQAESFTLANVVPQDRTMNRNVWAAIEESVRRLAVERGTLFVLTGPIFSGDSSESINGRVLVPTQVFKAIYDPARRIAPTATGARSRSRHSRNCPASTRSRACPRPRRPGRWTCRNPRPTAEGALARARTPSRPGPGRNSTGWPSACGAT
jgi:DNA/RNA endonuclease G (NUC1)